MGYHRAGFEVIGVDSQPQPRYPFPFIQGDAMAILQRWQGHLEMGTNDTEGRVWFAEDFDAIHASPPCQRFSTLTRRQSDHDDLYRPTRELLVDQKKSWVIENVIGAPYDPGVVLCGSMFGLRVQRHRNFETSWLMFNVLRCSHGEQGRPITVVGNGGGKPTRHSDKGIRAEWPQYMGMPWATPKECTQAIPPAYTEYIGKALMETLKP